jgi:RHS repeat-associated protein
MRKFIYIFFVFIGYPFFIFGEWDDLFTEQADPAVFQHVNVISGNLNISFYDQQSQEFVIPIHRTYSSVGALERSKNNSDLLIQNLRNGWMLTGGWSLFPHTYMLIEAPPNPVKFRMHLPEPNGNMITYLFDHSEPQHKHILIFKPEKVIGQGSGEISRRNNPSYNRLKVDMKTGKIECLLSNGGVREYSGPPLRKPIFGQACYYRLEKETLPNQHLIFYEYEKKKIKQGKKKTSIYDLKKIRRCSPDGTIEFDSITFDYKRGGKRDPFHLTLHTADGNKIKYKAIYFEGRQYLSQVTASNKPNQIFSLIPGRKGIGARVSSVKCGGMTTLSAEYYLPQDQKKERKWADKPQQKDDHIDKVKTIFAPIGKEGQEKPIAQFAYEPSHTDVRDQKGLLRRYHHQNTQLIAIEYFDDKDELHSVEKFFWKGSFLHTKALFNSELKPILAKSFVYEEGNVIEETIWGNITGDYDSCLEIKETGEVIGKESYTKYYSYYKDKFHLLKSQWEEQGPKVSYFYYPNTDLLKAKFTEDQDGKICLRAFFFYNKDHLLCKQIEDNGVSENPEDLEGVTHRSITKMEHHPKTGLPILIEKLFWDPNGGEKLLLKKVLSYQNRKLIKEDIYDANDDYSHTNTLEYNRFGQVTRQITPQGEEESVYDHLGRLIEVKKVGSPRIKYVYNHLGKKTQQTNLETGKFAYFIYNSFGQLIQEITERGHKTSYEYDCFGNRVRTTFSDIYSYSGIAECPITYLFHDNQGNITCAVGPLGETTKTTYNILKQPLQVIHPDQSVESYSYYKNGLLKKAVHPDLSATFYTYDIFGRKTSEQNYDKKGELLCEKRWVFEGSNLISYIDERGHETTFIYDGACRKVEEDNGLAKVRFTYDLLGFLEKIDTEEKTVFQKHDLAGRVTQQWEQEPSGKKENVMHFTYDHEGRKIKAERVTSCGIAVDEFFYKNYQLVRHKDPDGNDWQFLQEDYCNEHGQIVLKKTTIDPKGNQKVDIFDVTGKPFQNIRYGVNGKEVSKEERYYDLSGNLKQLISYVYEDDTPKRESTVSWEYDSSGRVILQKEGESKTTGYTYDQCGRVIKKKLPSGTELFHTYDALGRLIHLFSSDHTVDEEWIYDKSIDPIKAINNLSNIVIYRTYDCLGQIIEEKSSDGITHQWNYDRLGRLKSHILPDGSQIQYEYIGSHMSSVQRVSKSGAILYEHRYCSYDANGHVNMESCIFDLGDITTGHDLFERTHTRASPWYHENWEYDASGLVKKKENTLFDTKEYEFDALDHLKREGESHYHFDSIGNPTKALVNECNQLLSLEENSYSYDKDGNCTQDHASKRDYSYDALGRLKAITYPNQKKVEFDYDAFSRLYSKKVIEAGWISWQETKTYYLYDSEYEIGTLDEQLQIQQLKVNGLGIKEDLGAAIALEISGEIYAPIHDFVGNIIALISREGEVKEKYEISAFGKETSTGPPLSPWRFSSKRNEEGLIFFGLRFYDPNIGRWITPDPSGFSDSFNLYLFVLNNPLNRLDLFGLTSEPFQPPEVHIYIPKVSFLDNITNGVGGTLCEGRISRIHVDFYVFHTQWHKLQFTPEEQNSKSIDLMKHLHELIPSSGGEIVLTSFGNGIATSLEDFKEACKCTSKEINGPLMISLYNPTQGLNKDIERTFKERKNISTPTVAMTRQFLACMSDQLEKINPEAYWFTINHSENGVILRNAIDTSIPWVKTKLQNSLYILPVGPAECIKKSCGKDVLNIYSDRDGITGYNPAWKFNGRMYKYKKDPDYKVEILKAITPRKDRIAWHFDHSYLGKTYFSRTKEYIKFLHKKVGFYGKENKKHR